MTTPGSRPEVVCLGEALVDLVPAGEPLTYTAQAGGAPANVAAALARLGRRSALIGRVGDDAFGRLLARTLEECGVSAAFLQVDAHASTGLSVVARPGEQPPFSLYRDGTADTLVEVDRPAAEAIGACSLLHLGSLLTTSPRGVAAFERAVTAARDAGVPVSTDVNLRPSAWPDEATMVGHALAMVEVADVVKITAEELRVLGLDGGAPDPAKLWLVTDGERGAELTLGAVSLRRPAPPVPVLDTTGAGDASLAALLHGVLEAAPATVAALTVGQLERGLRWAVRAGSILVQHAGAMAHQPSREDLGP